MFQGVRARCEVNRLFDPLVADWTGALQSQTVFLERCWYSVAPISRSVRMNVNQIVAELKQERDRLDVAIAALQGAGGSTRRRGRPAGISKGARSV